MTPAALDPTYTPVADHALLVEFATEVDDAANRAVIALDRALTAENVVGVRELVPAYVALLVLFDPLITDHETVAWSVRRLLPTDDGDARPSKEHEVLVCYEGELAPDLPAVSAATGLGVDAVIDAHLAGDYRVFMCGFAPGCAYLAGVPAGIQVPRKPTAVRDIAAGSVIIAGPQCLVTTLRMPTGWSIIGRSPTEVLRDDPDDPFLFDLGDRVTFRRIDLATYDRLVGR